jgi:hypothetical protein
MDAELVTLAAAWTNHATYGLAAKLAALTPVSGDTLPSAPTLLTERASGPVARWHVPDEKTVAPGASALLLAVAGGDAVDQQITEQAVESEAYRLVYTYVQRTHATHTAVTNASYVLRALRQSWLAFNAGHPTESDAVLNDVAIVGVRGFTTARRFVDNDDAVVLHDCVVTFHVRDDLP